MKVSVSLLVEVDAADWTLAFGTPAKEVRKDVREYVHGLVEGGGVFGNGEVSNHVTLK